MTDGLEGDNEQVEAPQYPMLCLQCGWSETTDVTAMKCPDCGEIAVTEADHVK